MTLYRNVAILGAVASAAVLPLAFASSASATSIIGVGNSAHDNACTNQGGPRASGATAYAAGVVTALTAALPVGIATNQCGGLGSPTMDQGLNDVANCSSVLGTAGCAGNNFQTGGQFGGGVASGGGAF